MSPLAQLLASSLASDPPSFDGDAEFLKQSLCLSIGLLVLALAAAVHIAALATFLPLKISRSTVSIEHELCSHTTLVSFWFQIIASS